VARKYSRDNRGRFASSGTGATARGGRLKTASGGKRATQTRQIAAAPKAGTVAKPKGLKQGAVTAKAATKTSAAAGQSTRLPAAQRPGSLTNTLGNTMRSLARADAARIREIESITGQKIRRTPAGAGAGKEAGARVRAVAKGGKVGPTLRAGLRELAQSDARSAREMASIVRDATPKLAGGKGGKAIRGGRPALPGGKAKVVAAKPAATKPAASGKRARLDGEAFAARARRASSTALRRSINESDRENALSGAQRRATAPAKRFAASNQRQARADRTAAAAKAFYSNYGSPSAFARRQRQSTASSPSFGVKRRGKKR
jgi:hypothetical protein